MLAAAVVALVGAPEHAAAHERGVLRLPTRQLVVGDSVRVVGEKFGRGTALTLALVGIDGRVTLGEVRSDTAGAFARFVEIPADIRPGAYRLVAIASDDDEVATLDVTVSPPRSLSVAAADGDAHTTEPTAEPLELERARHPIVSGGAVAVIVLALLVGGALLRRPKEIF